MKSLGIYQKMELIDENDVFEYFLSKLKLSNRNWKYFVDWVKVFKNISDIEMELNLLNYLIGKSDIEKELRLLIRKYPKIIKTFPILIAWREKEIKILVDYKEEEWRYKTYNFKIKKEYSDEEIDDFVEFTKDIKLLEIFENKRIKNIIDYVIGIEVGMGTNGRKNRSGTIMEEIVEYYIKEMCNKLGIDYISQATEKKIFKKWQIEIKVNEKLGKNKANRAFDFVINKNDCLFFIETNFYGGNGSKVKSTAGEYITLNELINEAGYTFVWITDGFGIKKTKSQIKETFEKIDYLLNMNLVYKGALEEIINE